jgi:glucokinase
MFFARRKQATKQRGRNEAMAGKESSLKVDVAPGKDPATGVVIGVDLGGTRVRAALSDTEGNILVRAVGLTEAYRGISRVMSNIGRTISAVAEYVQNKEQIIGLGIGAPGPLNPNSGVIYSPPNLPGWKDVPLRDLLETETGLPVFLGNDANLAALGEFSFGAGKQYNNLVYVTVSTGVGAGVVENGRLLLGAHGGAAEVGHMTIDINGPLCNCGNIGCLEALASGTAIRRRAIAALATGNVHSLVREWVKNDLDAVTPEQIAKAAQAGDKFALDLLEETGFYLGVGITNVLHLYNPEIVVLGGGVSQMGDLIFRRMREVINERAMASFRQGVPIVVTELGDEIGLYGAFAIVLHNRQEALKRRLALRSQTATVAQN